NMHLSAVRESALRTAEARWQQWRFPVETPQFMEFPTPAEWRNTTKLNFEPTGFNYLGDPIPKKPGKQVADQVVNVAAALAEPAVGTDSDRKQLQLEKIVWDEIEEITPTDHGVATLSKALELYEPPVSPAKPQLKEEVQPTVPASLAVV